jgi:hypothetical protein
MQQKSSKHAKPTAQSDRLPDILNVITAIAGVVAAIAAVASVILPYVLPPAPASPPAVVNNITTGGDVNIEPPVPPATSCPGADPAGQDCARP